MDDNQQSATPSDKIHLRVERQFGQIIGTNIRTFNQNNQLIVFAKAKAFVLREEINFFSDEQQTNKIFTAKARNIIDLSPTFDMTTADGKKIGALKREGLMSAFARDQWQILDSNDNQIGLVAEDSFLMGVIRRHIDFVSLFLPQTYTITLNNQSVAEIKQRKNPFTVKYDIAIDSQVYQINQLLFHAIASLLAVIEARQN